MIRSQHVLILALLFGSGALSLAYQMVWGTLLLDELGVSAYSHAAVLATFMGGLALGSAWLGRLADRLRMPLRLLAGLELGVGLYAFASPWLFAALHAASTAWIPSTAGPASLLGRTAVAALLLLPPTVLMGGTYPVALRQLMRSEALIGKYASQLYAANAAGAVLGALATTFALVPALGVTATLRTLGWGNLALAGGALLLSRWAPSVTPDVEDPLPAASGGRRLWIEALLVAAAGFVSFSLEIVWIRFFSLILASSVYSFAIIVASFISGITLGGLLLGARRQSIAQPLRLFAWTQAGLGLLLMLVAPLHPQLGVWFAVYRGLFSGAPDAFLVYEAGKLLFCFVVVLAPATLIGMSLPLLVEHVARRVAHLGGDAGRVYAWNTWGNVVGALAAGLLLLPLLGMERLLRVSALLAGLVGLAAAWRATGQGARTRHAVAAAVLLTALLNALVPPWDVGGLTLSPFRQGAVRASDVEATLRRRQVLMFRDDPAANVAVVQRSGTDASSRLLIVNGKPDASSDVDMPTQLLIGHLPLLLHPDPKRVLVVGLASGSTAGAVLVHPVDHVDTVELVRAMPEAAAFFDRWNGTPLSDPRHRLVIEDARRFLETSAQRYDVIVSEPPNPWVAGVGDLFTERFYRAVRQRLRPHGILMQWVHAYEMSDDTFAVVVRTLHESFPIVYGFQGLSNDVLLLASSQPLEPDWTALERRMRVPDVARQLSGIGVQDAADLLALQRFSPATIDAIARQAREVNTMDNRLLEQRGPRELFERSEAGSVVRLDERLQSAPSLLWSAYVHAVPDVPIHPMRDARMAIPALEGARLTAAVHQDPALLSSPRAFDGFPATLLAEPPPTPEDIAARVLELAGSGRSALAAVLLERYEGAVLLEAAVDPRLARFWLERSAEWRAATASSDIRRFRIELLMATRRLPEAASELESWVDERRPPNADWAMRQACLIDRDGLCGRVAASLSRPAGAVSRSP